MKNIKEYNLDELKQELISVGEKGYRAEQIFNWLYVEKVKSFDDMTNLSLELREKLKQNYTMCNFEILSKQECARRKCNRNSTNGISSWKNNMCIISNWM